jgi:hypothetical protein
MHRLYNDIIEKLLMFVVSCGAWPAQKDCQPATSTAVAVASLPHLRSSRPGRLLHNRDVSVLLPVELLSKLRTAVGPGWLGETVCACLQLPVAWYFPTLPLFQAEPTTVNNVQS